MFYLYKNKEIVSHQLVMEGGRAYFVFGEYQYHTVALLGHTRINLLSLNSRRVSNPFPQNEFAFAFAFALLQCYVLVDPSK